MFLEDGKHWLGEVVGGIGLMEEVWSFLQVEWSGTLAICVKDGKFLPHLKGFFHLAGKM